MYFAAIQNYDVLTTTVKLKIACSKVLNFMNYFHVLVQTGYEKILSQGYFKLVIHYIIL